MHDKSQLVNEIIDVISKEGMVDRDKVTPDATIESLDLKSFDRRENHHDIDEKFDVYIPMDGTFQDAQTVQQLVDALASYIKKAKQGKTS